MVKYYNNNKLSLEYQSPTAYYTRSDLEKPLHAESSTDDVMCNHKTDIH